METAENKKVPMEGSLAKTLVVHRCTIYCNYNKLCYNLRMSRLRSAFEIYKPQVTELYEGIDSGCPVEELGAVAHGGDSYVFVSQADPESLIKLPVVETSRRSHGRKVIRRTLGALSLGTGHPRLEKIKAYDSKTMPSIVTSAIAGKGLDIVSDVDTSQIDRTTFEEVLDTFNYMQGHGLTIEGEIRQDVILTGSSLAFIDYVRSNYPLSQKIEDLGWMLATMPDVTYEEQQRVASEFFDLCATTLSAQDIEPLRALFLESHTLKEMFRHYRLS